MSKAPRDKRSSPRKPPRAKAPRKRAPAPKAGGPVTLAQAKAIVLARRQSKLQEPARRRAMMPKAPNVYARGVAEVEAASPRKLAVERKKLQLQRKRENRRRIKDYAAILKIMKRRGVKGLTTEGGPRRDPDTRMRAEAHQPLQILAEGDSWFDYPVPFFGGGIITRLEDLVGVPILNLAKAGDEVRLMLGVEERNILVQQLQEGCPAGGPWDVLLFSGGGNDVVDNPMALWVKDFDPTIPAVNHIHQNRFNAVLSLIRAGYEDLISMRDALSPTTHLFFHAYDFAIPDGRGICHLGPWMKPTFDLRGFPRQTEAFEVVKAMLKQFAAVLQSLSRKDVTFINTQGKLSPRTSSWHNELHPHKEGFKTFANMFYQALKAQFPRRVL